MTNFGVQLNQMVGDLPGFRWLDERLQDVVYFLIHVKESSGTGTIRLPMTMKSSYYQSTKLKVKPWKNHEYF